MLLVSCASRPTDPTELYWRWIELGNRADVDGQVRLLADDAVLLGWNFCLRPCRGRADIRLQLDRLTVLNRQSTAVEVRVAADRVVARREVRSDGTRRAGVERIMVSDDFRISGGRIVAAEMLMDLRDPLTATYFEFMRAEGGFQTPDGFRSAS